MLIRADGTAESKLDCNRGFGRLESETNRSSNSGSLTFLQAGLTKALGQPQAMIDRVAADLSTFEAFQVEGEKHADVR